MLLESPLVISDVPEWHSVGLLLEFSLVIILPLFLTLSLLTTALVVCTPRSGLCVPIRLVLDLLGFFSPSLCWYPSKSVAVDMATATDLEE